MGYLEHVRKWVDKSVHAAAAAPLPVAGAAAAKEADLVRAPARAPGTAAREEVIRTVHAVAIGSP